jgi:integrase
MPLKLIRRPRSPFWYIRGSIRGVNVIESTGLVDETAAQDVLTLRAAEILQESIHGPSVVRSFADAAHSYMAAGGERTHLNPIIAHFGLRKLSAIGQDEIDAAAAKLKPHAGPATRNRHVYTPISAVLHHAAGKRWCAEPVIARPKEPKGRVRWISFDEAELLIGAAAPHIRPLVIFLLSTGARLSEALYLDWRNVDLRAAHVVFLNEEGGGVGTKNGDSRGVPLHPRAVAALSALPHRTGAVFRRSLGRVTVKGKITPAGPGYSSRGGKGGGQVKTGWNAMLRRAGMSNFTPHDCRHTWATWHYRANRDITALMELGGWKTAGMVMRYAHVNTAHLAGSINRIWTDVDTMQIQAHAEIGKSLPRKA